MRGPDLQHLTIDRHKIFSSAQSGKKITEDLYNYYHWLMGPYSLDGQHFYSLSHSEWYACLLNSDCERTTANGLSATLNSWVTTVNSFESADGGASWHFNTVHGSHVVVNTGYHWTGSKALSEKIYLKALYHTGMLQVTRVIKEAGYYYCIGYYIHRDFSQVAAIRGAYEAPIDKTGYVLLRTNDITNPNDWQAWTTRNTYEPLSGDNFKAFLPQKAGISLDAGPPQIIFDTRAKCYILVHSVGHAGSSNPVYYMTTRSLASPSWSESTPILGTAELLTDPSGSVHGFNGANYPSILDADSEGFNFEFTSGRPQLFFSTSPGQYGGNNFGRDIYRVQLSVTYR